MAGFQVTTHGRFSGDRRGRDQFELMTRKAGLENRQGQLQHTFMLVEAGVFVSSFCLLGFHLGNLFWEFLCRLSLRRSFSLRLRCEAQNASQGVPFISFG